MTTTIPPAESAVRLASHNERAQDPAYRLLLDLVRAGATGTEPGLVNGADLDGVDWPHLLGLARAHGVVPLLARALEPGRTEGVPEALLEDLRTFNRSVAMQNLRLVHETQVLDELLTENGIDSIFFKGPLLAVDAYGGLGFRRSGDIDVLVAPDRMNEVDALLLQRDFVPFNKIQRLSPLRKRVHLHLTRQLPYRAEKRVPIDLHSGVVGMGFGFSVAFADLYRRSRMVRVGGTAIRTFSPEDMLLVLCYQGVNNRWVALKYLSDLVAHIHSHDSLDWEMVRDVSESMGGGRIVRHGLDLAKAVLGCQLPDEVLCWIDADARMEPVQRIIRDHLRTGLVPQLSFRERMRYYPGVQNTLGGKSRYILYSIGRRLVSPAVD